MNIVDLKTFAKFAVLEALYWAFIAAFAGYASTYLLACGLSSTALSIMLACYMGFSFAGAFFWGGMCDRMKTNRKVFIFEFAATLLIALAIFFTASQNVWLAAFMYPLFGFLFAPLGSNLDSWMLRSFQRDAAIYGRARSLGSVGYAVMMLLMGQLINHFGFTVMPVVFGIAAAAVLALSLVTKELPYETRAAAKKESPKALLSVRPYMFLVVILFTTGLAVSPINNLKTVIISSVGGDVSILGLDSFIGVMVQAVFIFISGNLRRISADLRLLLMCVCVLITMILTFTATGPEMIIIGTVFNNISYGLMLPTMREITEKSVTGALRNTAHSLSDAMYGSFAGIIALLYSGVLMDRLGARSVAVLGAVIMLIPVGLSALRMLRSQKNQEA
ncbi:MAG: MFS transporter [Erysipelotrichaceae bacterium]|nr:MFS transporter [Erysipelotrichaceae bacterium]